jgi:hypothetical protein
MVQPNAPAEVYRLHILLLQINPPIWGYTREAAIRPNRHRLFVPAGKVCQGLVTIGGPKYLLHPLLGAEEAFLC